MGMGIDIAADAANTVIGTGLGLLLEKHNDKRQLRQQGKLMNQQIGGQKEMGMFNREQAMQMWKDTNYSAQRAEMEKAGINPGLMYGGAGSGGTTQGAGQGNVTGGQAQTGQGGEMGMGMQMALMKAQKENIEADTENKQADAKKKGGVDTAEGEAKARNLDAITKNEATKNEILQFTKAIEEINARISAGGEADVIEQMNKATEEAKARVRKLNAEANVSEETTNEQIKLMEQAVIEKGIDIKAKQVGIQVDKKQMEVMAANIVNMREDQRAKWREWGQRGKEIDIKAAEMELKKMGMEFDTSTPEKIKQWTNIIGDLIPLAGGSKKVGFKY